MSKRQNQDIIEIYAGTSIDAAIVKTMLEDAGIQAYLKDDHMGTIAPFHFSGGGVGAVKIIIRAEHYEEAKAIVEQFDK